MKTDALNNAIEQKIGAVPKVKMGTAHFFW